MTNNQIRQMLFTAAQAAYNAGLEIMQVYENENFQVETKEDDSPLTLADKHAHESIMQSLDNTGIPVLSEEGESHDFEKRKNRKYFWLVDPLDGTKEFIKKNNEFTVNIALTEKDTPVAGVIYVPVFRQMYLGEINTGAFKKDNVSDSDFSPGKTFETFLQTSQKLPIINKHRPYTAVASRSHRSEETREFLQKLEEEKGPTAIISKGSSLKICMVAEGKADIYPRFGPTMEWDTGAGHAIALASGASVNKTDGTPLLYNKENLLNPYFIVKRNS